MESLLTRGFLFRKLPVQSLCSFFQLFFYYSTFLLICTVASLTFFARYPFKLANIFSQLLTLTMVSFLDEKYFILIWSDPLLF